jgi:hypothetical protein
MNHVGTRLNYYEKWGSAEDRGEYVLLVQDWRATPCAPLAWGAGARWTFLDLPFHALGGIDPAPEHTRYRVRKLASEPQNRDCRMFVNKR